MYHNSGASWAVLSARPLYARFPKRALFFCFRSLLSPALRTLARHLFSAVLLRSCGAQGLEVWSRQCIRARDFARLFGFVSFVSALSNGARGLHARALRCPDLMLKHSSSLYTYSRIPRHRHSCERDA